MRSDEPCATRDQNSLCHDNLADNSMANMPWVRSVATVVPRVAAVSSTHTRQRLYLCTKRAAHVSGDSTCRIHGCRAEHPATGLAGECAVENILLRTVPRSGEFLIITRLERDARDG